jgi:hypothetical protein
VERFLKRHEGRIKGIISGFDRILFKGTLRSIAYSSGLEAWLASRKILQKDFAAFALTLTERIIQSSQRLSRLLRLLKEHRLIHRVRHTNLYRLTATGLAVAAFACKVRSLNVMENLF